MFSYTPKELWEKVERLADAANESCHEGLGGGKNSHQNTQGGANRSNKKVNDTKRVQHECGICLLLGSTARGKSHSTENHRWSAHDHKIIGENVSSPPDNSDRNARQVQGGKGIWAVQKLSEGSVLDLSKLQDPRTLGYLLIFGLHTKPIAYY